VQIEAGLTFLKAAILAPASDLDPIPLIASGFSAIGISPYLTAKIEVQY